MGGQLNPSKPDNWPALAHANVDGIRLKIPWGVFEPTEGNRSWATLDNAIAKAKAQNKKASISVEAGSGDECPNWVYAAGAKSHTITSGKRAGQLTPMIGDPIYLAKWVKTVAALGAKYDANPSIGYMVMCGIGNTVEWYQPDAAFFQAQSPPNPPGTAKWIAQAKAVIDAYAAAFPTTPFFGALATPFGAGAGLAAEKTVVDWAVTKYKGRFGLMTNTLSARSTTNFYPCAAINQYRSTQPVGFQMLWSCHDGGVRNGKDGVNPDPNALDESLTNGVNIGGRFVEVYELDCNDPALQATITKHQAQFKALP